MQQGQIEREEDAYEREGTCSVFVAVEPLSGKRFIQARARRTKVDWAYFMRELLDVHYPQAAKLVLARQALSGRIPSLQAVQERVACWLMRRNQAQATIEWRLTTADARIKLQRLYPSIEA